MAEDTVATAPVERPAERKRIFLAVAPWPRALLETVAIAALLVALLPVYPGHNSAVNLLLSLTLLIGPAGCALWLALRLRMSQRKWYLALPVDAGFGLLMALAPSLILLLLFQRYAASRPQRADQYFIAQFVITLIFVFAFVCYRMGVRLWLWWDTLRRRSLRWALTHALLSVAAGGAALLGITVFTVVLILTRPNAPLFQWITALVFIAALLIIGILIALPPSALFSFLFARGASRRILDLAQATEQLRSGDYTARSPVQGEDEVARLQTNFNAMATDLERGVRDLRAERDNVAQLLTQRRELLASVSHELRTPVATVRSYLESATLRWNDATPEALRHDVEVMLHETQRLQTLIDDLFTLARAEVGRLDLRCEPTDIGELARRAVQTMAPVAWRSARVEVVARVSPALPMAQIDASRTEQALHNLLRNAIRHTAPGGIIAVIAERAGDRLALRVSDTGEGIDTEDLPRIWERFYRSERTRFSDSSGGSGLGLALVKEVIEAMGGEVSVKSEPGAGSIFSLALPLSAIEAAPQEVSTPNESPEHIAAS